MLDSNAGVNFSYGFPMPVERHGHTLAGISAPTLTVPPPRRPGGRVLYLDYDGVLHPEGVYRRRSGPYIAYPRGHELFEHGQLLEEVLKPYADMRIVLSTSWVCVYKGVRRVASRLTPSLRARVVGATYHKQMDVDLFSRMPRGMQVWSDVLRRQPIEWLAIDDDSLHWPSWCRDRLVVTDSVLGISEPTVLEELRVRLAAIHSSNRGAV